MLSCTSSGGGLASAPPAGAGWIVFIPGGCGFCTFSVGLAFACAVFLAVDAAVRSTFSAALIASGEYLLCCNHKITFAVVGFSPDPPKYFWKPAHALFATSPTFILSLDLFARSGAKVGSLDPK